MDRCPYCKYEGEHVRGYGFAGPSLGAYTYCGNDDCGKLLEFCPDLEGLVDEAAEEIMVRVRAWQRERDAVGKDGGR